MCAKSRGQQDCWVFVGFMNSSCICTKIGKSASHHSPRTREAEPHYFPASSASLRIIRNPPLCPPRPSSDLRRVSTATPEYPCLMWHGIFWLSVIAVGRRAQAHPRSSRRDALSNDTLRGPRHLRQSLRRCAANHHIIR